MRNPLEDVMNGIVAASKKDQIENSVVYRDLTANAESDRQTLFSVYELAVGDAVSAMCDVIKDKYGIKRMSNELYEFISSYPHEFRKLSRHIEKTEGRICCVDKAWSRMMATFDELVKDNVAKEES